MNPTLHLDTSVLVKLYVREAGTDSLLAASQSHPLRSLSISRVEFASALWRRARAGDLEEATADELVRRLARDFGGAIAIVPLSEDMLTLAAALCRRHALRAYDAVQLAGALQATASGGGEKLDVFSASDDVLLAAARAEGLQAWNPATTPAPR